MSRQWLVSVVRDDDDKDVTYWGPYPTYQLARALADAIDRLVDGDVETFCEVLDAPEGALVRDQARWVVEATR